MSPSDVAFKVFRTPVVAGVVAVVLGIATLALADPTLPAQGPPGKTGSKATRRVDPRSTR